MGKYTVEYEFHDGTKRIEYNSLDELNADLLVLRRLTIEVSASIEGPDGVHVGFYPTLEGSYALPLEHKGEWGVLPKLDSRV